MSGIGGATTAIVDRSRADLIALPAGDRSFAGGVQPDRNLPLLFMHPNVRQVQDLDGKSTLMATVAGSASRAQEQVYVVGIDLESNSLTLPGDFPESARSALLQPRTVVIDRSLLSRMGIQTGDRLTLNGRLVELAGTVSTYPSVLRPVAFVSRDTLRLLDLNAPAHYVGTLLIGLHDPASAERTSAELNEIAQGSFHAYPREQLAHINRRSFMTKQVIGLTLGFSALLGLGIGLGVTSQSMRSALLSEIRPFAALRALGVPMSALRQIVFELALWMLGISCVAMIVCVHLLAWAADSYAVPFDFSWQAAIIVMAMLLGVAMLAGLSALRVLKQAQPMDLLR
ncbi:ABC transporter permease [Sphingomonas sp. DG1-23]|nr:ABC transporter permease [Sphingomonas sp. DG1-23]MDP5279864.1 ABC transporter permease [Sphingomonas sp. DG1-23]